MHRWLRRVIRLYRPTYVTGAVWSGDAWMLTYRTGDLRAQLWGVRVPIVWALSYVLTPPTLSPEVLTRR